MFEWLTPELGQILEGVSGVFTAFLGGLAILYAAGQLHAEKTRSKVEWATKLFADHLQRSLEFPDLATPDPKTLSEIDKMPQYEWFVGVMLFTMEAVISAFPRKRVWLARVEGQLLIHKDYLSTDRCEERYLRGTTTEMRKIVKLVLDR